MSNGNTVYAEINFDCITSRSKDIVLNGSRPATGYTIVVSAGNAKVVRFKYCAPVFTCHKQTTLKVDPAIALTNLLWGKCSCGYKVKDFASVVMGHKKNAQRDLVCPLCQASFPIKRCDVQLVGDDKDPSKDIIYCGPYASEAYTGLLFNAENPATEELVLPKLWFGYKPGDMVLPGLEGQTDIGDPVIFKGLDRNRLAYFEFDEVREQHYKAGAPSVRSVMLSCRPHTGMTTVDRLAGVGLPYSRCFFRQLYGR